MDIVRYDWDDWAAALVYKAKGPLVLKLVNDLPTEIPYAEFGIAGHFCLAGCIDPGATRTCRPDFGQASRLFIRISESGFPEALKDPLRTVDIPITWRTHGTLEIHVTDGGFTTVNDLDDSL
ncbi:MAG: hypothetical protein JST54_35970 [Deltaproteobacteria bacterium]|nr:hypothetical protein [Deltaproteobacteria bacterium]